MSNIYLTTAIPYVNGAPHIGHALDYCLADTYARYQKLLGNTVRLQAGTDEHGNKISQKAQALNLTPSAYVTKTTALFQDFIKELNVEYTDFIRTTNPQHQRRCQKIWQKLQPYIYLAPYEGWYCDGCERFVTDQEYKIHHGACPDHQKPYQKLSEQNYYFRLSVFKDKIYSAIKKHEMQILPAYRQTEILKLLKDTTDISISRPISQLSWGIPVPGHNDQVMYVWIDALANYLTVLGYPDQDISNWWPATAQFVGKDILRFHAIIWPALLLGLELPLPRIICSHGHILSHGQKMSKSIGNVVDPIAVLKKHGVDAFRYFFLRHIDSFADSDFTWEKFEDAYQNELANDLGNLIQRLATLSSNCKISLSPSAPNLPQPYTQFMDQFALNRAFDYVWTKIQALNKRIDDEKPWTLLKLGQTTELSHCLSRLVQELLDINFLLQPFIPATAQKIAQIFQSHPITPPTTPLFPKLHSN